MPKRLVPLTLSLATLLIACGGAAQPASSGAASVSASPASAKPATSSVAPAGSAKPVASASAKPAASGSAAAGANGGSIRIGVLEPLTGTQAGQGKDNQDGLNLFMSQINSTVAGRKIELTFADTEAKADVGVTKAKQLVENQKVSMLMGVSATPVCYAVATYVQQAQVPFAITTNCAAQDILTDPKYKSPYVSRFTINNGGGFAPGGAWLYQRGFRKASVLATDFAAGHEFADAFSAAFVDAGGSVVQIQYPAIGNQDFGPILAQLNPQADVVVLFLIGTDGLRFAQQFANYGGSKKPQVFETANITGGENLDTLKDSAVGMLASNIYTPAIDTTMNKDFLKAWSQKYPGRTVSANVANGYTSGQMLQAALQKVSGNIEDKQAFLNAIDATNIESVKGPIKLDSNHDIVENLYMYQVVKEGSTYAHKLLDTVQNTSEYYKWTPEQMAKLKIGKNAYKWTTMDKAQLDKVLNG
jgi:branched-chain amino acid transport system substrate-binding protein